MPVSWHGAMGSDQLATLAMVLELAQEAVAGG